jgi:F0F1-type ATP synthase membrane subunit b/b'
MEIVPDPFLVAMFLPGYLVAVLGSWFILWKPLFAWMQEREQASVSARSEAQRLEGEASDKLADVERRLQVVRTEIAEMRTSSRAEASAAEAERVAQARTVAEKRISEATQTITEQAEVARKGLAESSGSLAADMASQVLGRSVQA